MNQFIPRRSVLYVPGSNRAALEKARTMKCDAVIVDLEDSVAPANKETARENAMRAVLETREARGTLAAGELIVRVNSVDSPWGLADLAAAAAAGPDAVLVPKINDAVDIRRCDTLLADAPDRTHLWAMIETAKCISHLNEIASQTEVTRLSGWVMGTNDLATEMRASLDVRREPLLAILSLAVVKARANGLAILDGVFNQLDDDRGFEEQCLQGQAFGFDGKTLIHPRQIEPCHRIFTPSDAALSAAKAIVAAFERPENQHAGVLKVDGRMVERLHLEQAGALIAMRESIERRLR